MVGKEELEDGAVVAGGLGAAYHEAAVVALYDFGGDPEAQAGASDALGGVEGGVDVGEGFGGDADAVVGDGDEDALLPGAPLGGFTGTDAEAAGLGCGVVAGDAGADGVDGVGDEVVEDLADL